MSDILPGESLRQLPKPIQWIEIGTLSISLDAVKVQLKSVNGLLTRPLQVAVQIRQTKTQYQSRKVISTLTLPKISLYL